MKYEYTCIICCNSVCIILNVTILYNSTVLHGALKIKYRGFQWFYMTFQRLVAVVCITYLHFYKA